ncbi:phage holin family protein [Helcococcus kunzii]|uniref:phage holin family protein n=1 Tax=Helcococcus kunzii TaxID=40091 RepID=UPI001BAFBE40|nr:phage holin family protein [Helcococcus kunzii]QUY64301.1 phage holin family protein [Helcococcus kunzii]
MKTITFMELKEYALILSQSFLYHALLIIILLDVLTGYAKAIKNKKLNSKVGTNGIIRHLIVIIIQTIVGIYSRALGFDFISQAVAISFIGNYGLSFLENLEAIGVPFNKSFKKYFEQMKEKEINVTNADVIIQPKNMNRIEESHTDPSQR